MPSPQTDGDTLQAQALAPPRSGRTGVDDLTVRRQRGKTIAFFGGKSYRSQGAVMAGMQHADAPGHTPT